ACYHRENPASTVITLEQNADWAKLLAPYVQSSGGCHDYRLCALEDRTIRHPAIREPIQTRWDGGRDLAGKRVDLILIDGPEFGKPGTTFTPYSRAGILEYMPALLNDHWIVVFDDAERYGEVMTMSVFETILRHHKMSFIRFEIHGEKSQTVYC